MNQPHAAETAAVSAAAAAAAADTAASGERGAERETVLVVDDTPANLSLLAALLSPHWRVLLATSGAKALELAARHRPDLILLDVMMPGLDGYETCRRLKADERTQGTPVIFLTALNQPEDETRGFDCGAADFIHKPVNPAIVTARVSAQLDAKRWRDLLAGRNAQLSSELGRKLQEVERLREATLHVMISFAEFRDENTGHHVKRTQEYVRTLARWMSAQGVCPPLSEAEIDHMARSAPLHDIGKVATPDHILLKPGKLSAEEMVVMKTHSMQGWEMLRRAADRMGDGGQGFLQHAMDIARHHHERWDGTGYPDGLAGAQIPLPARLMAAADVYDALISRRPYKEPMSHEAAMAYLHDNSGSHFDPDAVRAFEANADELRRIAATWSDEAPPFGAAPSP